MAGSRVEAGKPQLEMAMLRALAAALIALALTAGVASAEIEEVEQFASLAGITRSVDAVVLGRVIEARPGRVFSGCGYTAAIVEVERVLAGRMRSAVGDRLTLEYFGFCQTRLPEIGHEIPAERAAFFLRNGGVAAKLADPRASRADVERESQYWHLVILAGTVVDRGGLVHVPETLNAPFLASLEGTSFPGFVDQVRSTASNAPDTSTTDAVNPSPTQLPILAGLVMLACAGAADRRRRRAS